MEDKLLWTFNLYDLDHDGLITRQELSIIISSIYSIMGKYAQPTIDSLTIQTHVERVFQVQETPSLCVILIKCFCCSRGKIWIDGSCCYNYDASVARF